MIIQNNIESKILSLRGKQVMIDRDLAELYGVETRVLNQAVKRNIERFPEDFMFALEESEKTELVTNCDRFNSLKHSTVAPYAFTEQGIFFQGQIFDAYAKFETFLQTAKDEIILIDNYVDLSVLERLSKKQNGVRVEIYTAPKTKLTEQDCMKFNAQYPSLTVHYATKMHDRFLIIDKKILYHFGASLKDLGKKCFGFEILDTAFISAVMENL